MFLNKLLNPVLIFTIFLNVFIRAGAQLGCTNATVAPSVPVGTCGVAKVAPVTPNCALSNQAIVGGSQSVPLSWPWMVSLKYYGQHFCGGALVNSDTVITAAHCTNTLQAREIVVNYGNINVNDANLIKNPVREIRQHASFDPKTVVNDITILKLTNKVTFTDAIRPICLPTTADVPVENAACYATGWGDTKNASIPTTTLREVCLNVFNKQKCKTVLGIQDGMMCATVPAGDKDACQGDSGGPLSCKINGVWKLGGIVSWGVGCATPEYPGVYTDVSKYASWIQQNIV